MGAREVASADSSVLILLAKAGHLALLERAFDRVLVEAAVERECLLGLPARPDARAIEAAFAAGLFGRANAPVARIRELSRRHPSLGSGEVGAIAIADPVVLLDDWPARRIARLEGARPVGTLGVLLRARKNGALKKREDVDAALRDILLAGLWVDASVLASFWKEFDR